eukprot:TRINITY_DN55531_c0_g1_i1.p1 TRINITY_DN55531_c0_g1~~TRINITY_DN55531_c0_g1_i1.p1  ORF type:complete len:579 (-),score=90.63 TRINITY_DN55531_c0_g1_i1:1187-2923(-)
MASSSSVQTMKLSKKEGFEKPNGPVALIIMDGVGQAPDAEWNAVTTSRTPFLDQLMAGEGPDGSKSLFCELDASGKSVGLPGMGDMGNSEVGHNAMGAGRVFDQGAKLVNNAFRSGDFKSEVWQWLVEKCVGSDTNTLHMIGLYSDGNVHAHVNHVFQLIDGAVDDGVKRIRLHLLADGRDVIDRSALDYFGPLEKRLAALRKEGIDIWVASGGGRMVTTMDRYEADWGMVENGWRAHCLGDTTLDTFKSCISAVEHYYKDESMVDQYLPPFVIVDDNGGPRGAMQDGDSVLFWNFRGDRAIEISMAFEAEEGEFSYFDRKRVPDVRYAGMMQYDGDAGIPKRFLVSPPQIDRTVGEHVVKNGMKRFSVSETQKYGHVTYFYNGNRAAKFDEEMEKYVCIPSYKQREHTRPWMKAAEISDCILEEMDNFKPDLMVINYANGDMVGHTGHMVASRLAMECLDLCLARVLPEIIKREGIVILTADHGNCDIMAELGKDGKPKSGNQPEGWKAKVSHTKQRVPCMIIGKQIDKYELDTSARWADDPDCKHPGIANLGATVLNLLGLKEPDDYLPSILVPKC